MEDPSQADGKREPHVNPSVLTHDTDQVVSFINGSEERLLCSALHKFLSV